MSESVSPPQSPDTAIRIKCLAPRPMAALRLLCIPFAGGGATSFRGWERRLPVDVEVFAVQLPGREDRLRAPAIVDWTMMMQALTAALAPLPAMPTAIFGHSLGAVIGLELARWMEVRQPGRLRHLFVSGRMWPGRSMPADRRLDDLSDDDLLQALDRDYGSLSTSLSHPEIRELSLPVLRADLLLLDSHRYLSAPPLPCPLTALAGEDDPAIPPGGLAAWRQETRGPFRQRMLGGAHFYIETHREELLDYLALALAGGEAHGPGQPADRPR